MKINPYAGKLAEFMKVVDIPCFVTVYFTAIAADSIPEYIIINNINDGGNINLIRGMPKVYGIAFETNY
jgi:hypothetical protein